MFYFQSQQPQLTRVLADALLTALSARPAAALLDVPTVKLFTNSPTLSKTSVVGDFTEATFDGYAAIPLPTLIVPFWFSDEVEAVFGEVVFVGASPQTVPETINGYWVENTGGTVLYLAELFPTPIPISNPGEALGVGVLIPVSCLIDVAT